MDERKRGPLHTALLYAMLGGVCVVLLVPTLWALSTSLKTEGAVLAFPPQLVPNPITFEHYAKVLQSNMPRYYLNSFFVAMATILVVLAVAAHGAYATARFNFRGKNAYMLLILGTMMIPGVANIVPIYIVANFLQVLDSYTILILVYSVWMVPLIIWLLKGFFESVPSSLEQAAMIDGYSRWYAFYRIVMPLSKPGLAAAAIMVFVYVWNEFIMALTLTSSDEMRTVTVGLHYYVTIFGIQWGELTAAVVLSLVPVTLFFLLLQRYFISGMIAGAFKG